MNGSGTIARIDADRSPSARFIGCCRVDIEEGSRYPSHEHDFWELAYCVRGLVDRFTYDSRVSVHPGVLVATPPLTPHAENAVTSYSHIMVFFEGPADWGWPLVIHDTHGRIGQTLDALVDEAPHFDSEMSLLLLRQLELLFDRATETATREPHPGRDLVIRAEALMRQKLPERPTIEDLAQTLAVATSTLRAAFREERGVSPKQRLSQIRLAQVLTDLRTSTRTLEAVALTNGFASASHLSDVVVRATGKTPGAIRRHPATLATDREAG